MEENRQTIRSDEANLPPEKRPPMAQNYRLEATLTPEGSLAGRAFKWGFFVTLGVACALPVIFVLTLIASALIWGSIGGM